MIIKKITVICTTVLVETSPQAMPLGAACIASAIKNDVQTKNLFEVLLQDFSREDDYYIEAFKQGGEDSCAKIIAEKLAKKNPFAVAFSVYVWNHKILDKAAGELKKLCPDCVTIAGGPEVTAAPQNFSNFDYTVAGQGESAVPALLAELCSENASEVQKDDFIFPIPGVYKKGNFAAENSSFSVFRAVPCSPDSISSPYLDGTLDPAKYGGALWELARGCPFKCSYCYESKGEKKIAYFPMERLEKEIELFAEKKIPQVFVLDPTYNASKERAIKMLNIIRKKAPGMFFYFEARAEFIDRELAHAFSKVPCCIQFGLQSSNPAVLKNVHRTLDKKLFSKNIGFLNEEGVTFGFDLIYGLPGDNFNGFCDSIDFALSLYPNNLELFCLSVLPGTNLHDDAKNFGMVWDKNPPYHVIKTPFFGEEDLAKAKKLAEATNLFYTQGRAVPWFNAVLYPLNEKPSDFLWDFANYIEEKNQIPLGSLSSQKITELQKEFVRQKYERKRLHKMVAIAEDLIVMNGALGLCTFDGTESVVTTNYHPDDVMSEYGTDLEFFSKNAGKQKCRVKIFESKYGADWKTI
ncbi:B12-binding domain-containing radical SAM protein [Treponema zioleckii]|uniref:B12-binding domain-containing radical SAM protein n=1 Tax=Treponema zioleckii TaxID=331680 RepID=UPI00168B8A03|nr:radical SAM protein [Treponema zioleckii]